MKTNAGWKPDSAFAEGFAWTIPQEEKPSVATWQKTSEEIYTKGVGKNQAQTTYAM